MRLYLFLFILLTACSSRKVVIDEVKKDSLSQISTKIATEEVVKIETKNDVVTEEITITPLDTCKDIVVDGKVYKNVILSYKKTKDNTIQVQDIKVSEEKLKVQDTKITQNRKVKDIERKSINFLWIIIISLIIVLWLNKQYLLSLLKKI